MSTGEVPVVKSKLPIRLTLRHATGEMPNSDTNYTFLRG